MSRRFTLLVVAAALATGALAPTAAFGHAALVTTRPVPSRILPRSPAMVRLTYSEAVEPRFAVVSVTDRSGKRVTSSRPARAAGDANELDVPLKRLRKGWYLVYWRVISADGHPVRGAYTFAVGPNAGPPPRFKVPSLTETTATPGLLVTRWIVLLSMMCGVGLLVFRMTIAHPLLRRVPGASLRAVTVALGVTLGAALLATIVYVALATAQFAQVGVLHVATLVRLMRDSAFGRGYSDLALVLALLIVASALSVWVDRPRREHRSIAEIMATAGAFAAAAAALAVPGLAGHAGTYAPRGAALLLDWTHLLAGALWIGGLVGLCIVAWKASADRVACMVVLVPRLSRVAFCAVVVLVASGTIATVMRLPTLSSLWDTGYGQALMVKIGVLLATLALAAVNLLWSRPRLARAGTDRRLGESTTSALLRLAGGEAGLVAGAVFAASVLSSLAPPPRGLAQVGTAVASVGPGPVAQRLDEAGYLLQFRVTPNRAAAPNAFWVRLTKDGTRVDGADVTAKFTMLDMEMGQQEYRFREVAPSLYGNRSLPALVMAGHWGLDFTISPPGAESFDVLIVDRAGG